MWGFRKGSGVSCVSNIYEGEGLCRETADISGLTGCREVANVFRPSGLGSAGVLGWEGQLIVWTLTGGFPAQNPACFSFPIRSCS